MDLTTQVQILEKLLALHIALIFLGTVCIQLFSFQLIVGKTEFFKFVLVTDLTEGTLNPNL